MRRRRRPTDEEILTAIVALADDGFCERRELFTRLTAFGEYELMKSIARAVRRNLVIERRAKGRTHLSLTTEGWRVYRERSVSPS